MKKQIVIGMSGHIDHGKTSIVKALTGLNTDILDQEKERGMTIDLGSGCQPTLSPSSPAKYMSLMHQ